MAEPYLEVVSLVEQLHRQFLEIVKLELDGLGIHDLNNVQALMLFNIGDAEMSVGELTLRGCYLGSNVSYNVKKLVENGYIAQERSVHDRRSVHIKLTNKGRKLRQAQRYAPAACGIAEADGDHQEAVRVFGIYSVIPSGPHRRQRRNGAGMGINSAHRVGVAASRAARVEQKIVKIPKNEIVIALGRSKAAAASSVDLEKDLAIEEQSEKLEPRKIVLPAQ